MRHLKILILSTLLFVISGCSSGTSDFEAEPKDAGRKIVKTASVKLAVDDIDTKFNDIRNQVSKWDGFVANSNFRILSDSSRMAEIEISVPSSRLEEVLKELGELGKVLEQSESGKDVTDEYVDMESRLRNLQATETRLLKLMEQSGSVKDLLEVEAEVGRVRGEIETLQGRLNQIDHKVDYSSISIYLTRDGSLRTSDFWQFGEALQGGWSMFTHIVRLLVWMVIYGLFFLPFVLPVWWTLRRKSNGEK